jgi:hypothetical protein
LESEPHFLDGIFGSAEGKEGGWEVLCLILGLNTEDMCEGITSAKAETTSENDVLEIFNPEAPIASQKATCVQGGEGSGDMKGEYLILLTSGKALAVSE